MFNPPLRLPRMRILAAGTVPLHLRLCRLQSLLQNRTVKLEGGRLAAVTGEVRICFRMYGSKDFDVIRGRLRVGVMDKRNRRTSSNLHDSFAAH